MFKLIRKTYIFLLWWPQREYKPSFEKYLELPRDIRSAWQRGARQKAGAFVIKVNKNRDNNDTTGSDDNNDLFCCDSPSCICASCQAIWDD